VTGAALVPDGGPPTVRLERRLADPPAVVWEALTDREQLRQWFPCDLVVAGGRWQVGAAITFVFPPEVIDLTLTGEVLAVDPPVLLSFRWGDEVLRFELAPVDGGTRLVLYDELPGGGVAARNAAGWDQCLDQLAGHPAAAGAWRPRFEVYVAEFQPVLGPQEGPPEGYRGE
jgi:uncharacterized protein YndB with AHSA1/START domain